MSFGWQLRALLNKNLIMMKRNVCVTICELLYPLILMILVVLVRRAFKINEEIINFSDANFLANNATAYVNLEDKIQINPVTNKTEISRINNVPVNYQGFPLRYPLEICNKGNRNYVGIAGKNALTDIIFTHINKISPKLQAKYFNNVQEMTSYIEGDLYNIGTANPALCFGYSLSQLSATEFNYTLSYFDNQASLRGGISDIPQGIKPSWDIFINMPDQNAFNGWQSSGYIYMMKIINDVIYQTVSNNNRNTIDFVVAPEKYTQLKTDAFGTFIGFLLPFFVVIAYLSPLIIVVFRMIREKETKVKEGMKIMGLTESSYFFSWLSYYMCLTTFHAILNSLILTGLFKYVPFGYVFLFFWLYGMCIFSMAYFFQAIIDKTRIAMIISILIYFIMYFVSVAVLSEDVATAPKMVISLLPPTCLQLGLVTLSRFEINFLKFDSSLINLSYQNFSAANFYTMLVIDIFVYLFLGFYLQNIVSQQFGVRKPFYFLCTRSFWGCGKSKRKIGDSKSQNYNTEKGDDVNLILNDKEKFQDEKNYEEKIQKGDYFKVTNLVKNFGSKTNVVDGVSLNFYRDEIFALLGHNGAGKTTIINILTGIYEKTSGYAQHRGNEIFENMDEYRKIVGICPQQDVLFEQLTVREHLRLFSIFKGKTEGIDADVDKVINDLELNEKANAEAKTLSGGQKRKLSIGIALIGGSEIVFLDEPSSGMDITSRRKLWDILKRCTQGRIIILTTHFMEEAAVLGKRIGILSSGKMKCLGSPLFLIDKFGKYLSVNVIKQPGNNNDEKIIKFFQSKVENLRYDVFSEEILFRIPKNANINKKDLFRELDDNLAQLGIKTYGASMPTLEDVFLNVSAETKNLSQDNSREIIKKPTFEKENSGYSSYDPQIDNVKSGFTKFFIDIKAVLYKRYFQIIRDRKSFLLEFLCPIILVLIGCGVSSIKFIQDAPTKLLSYSRLPNPQYPYVNTLPFTTNNANQILTLQNYLSTPNSSLYSFNYTTGFSNPNTNYTDAFLRYNDYVYSLKKVNDTSSNNYLGNYYVFKIDNGLNNEYTKFEVGILTNSKSVDAPLIYTQEILSNLISRATNQKITINGNSRPFPFTKLLASRTSTRNTSNLVFFVSIAFSLIPANFITVLIKERESNSKHLQLISGIGHSSYWVSNFIFELIKYYFSTGICLGIIYGFDNFPEYFWALWLIYGPSIIAFTYMTSFMFKTESASQNFTILFNFVIGALGGTVVFVLRVLEDLVGIGKGIAWILRVIPSFAFSYGYQQLLGQVQLLYVDNKDNLTALLSGFKFDILSTNYFGADLIYLGAITGVAILVLFLLEFFTNKISFGNKQNPNPPALLTEDEEVIKESEKLKVLDPSGSEASNYSIVIKNLEKSYGKNKAIQNISFGLNYGECFALLGVNGAGKTTTFKCLTNEVFPSKGHIYIAGKDSIRNFEDVRRLIGYCPQFDAIFEYMTVSENLYYYSLIKGIPAERRLGMINSIIDEMKLSEQLHKPSGTLSGGNKRKLSVAIAMLGNPPIIFLDEPSNGMDPEARRFMWAVIQKISTQRKKSSVILTTHSMEEAETLCRRMGIMVKGRFKCLGTSTGIKDRYGAGFEIDLTINSPEQNYYNQKLNLISMNNETIIKTDDLPKIIKLLGEEKIGATIKPKDLGTDINEELINGTLTAKKLIDFIHNSKFVVKLINKLLNSFSTIKIAEYYENTYKVKIYKQDRDMKSIGFVFGVVEDNKDDCNITEYSICQTSLEQIFNKFAFESGSENENPINNPNAQNMQQDEEELLTASRAAYKLTKPEISITQEFANGLKFD